MALPVHKGEVPYLTRDQMAEADRLMTQVYKIDPLQWQESVGRNLAYLARLRFLEGDPKGKPVAVLAGGGSNGACALACARRLLSWGANVHIALGKHPKTLSPTAKRQLEILDRMHADIDDHESLGKVRPPAVIIDGIIGNRLHGAPRDAASIMIHWANAQKNSPVLALEVPSGIDSCSGVVHDPAIEAKATLALGLPKEGLKARGTKGHVGEIYLADLGVPISLLNEPSLKLNIGPLFATEEVLRLR